jgi:site-specific recombinase XerD
MSTIKVTSAVKQEIDRYRQFMLEHEYTAKTATGYSTYLSRFLRRHAQDRINALEKSVSGFLEEQRERNPKTYKECRAAIYLYFKMATGKNFPRYPPNENNPEIDAIVQPFYDYSVGIKQMKTESAKWESASVRRFLNYITGNVAYSIESITAQVIRDYVVNCLAHMADSSKGREITAIRNFLRYRKFNGELVHESILMLPLSPAVWKNSAFPTTMDEVVFNRLHEAADINTPTGKRDCCIILCFTELALRSVEVAALTVDDFCWREGYVAIKNTKSHEDRKLPISEKLAQAVIEYLIEARPQTVDRTLFVRFKHTCGEPMGVGQIRSVVRRVYVKSGVDIKPNGPHILRRTAGSRIFNSGNSLKMTADILGHESLDSTVYYVKADITELRHVAAPWPIEVGRAGVQYV